MPRRVTLDSGDREEVDVKTDKRYIGVGYRYSMVATTVCFDGDVEQERLLPMDGCDWVNANVIDKVWQDEHLDSFCFGSPPVEGQALRLTVDGKSWVGSYCAWKCRFRSGESRLCFEHVLL